MKTFNKKGDQGQTSLLFGRRTDKDNPRCEAYGTLDEAISALGVARNQVNREKTKEIILKIQKELFTVGAELATDAADKDKFNSTFKPITLEMVQELENLINTLESQTDMPKIFIIPGGTTGSAYLDLARTMIRRAERRVVTLKKQGEVKNDFILEYLNRLADLLFTLARYEESPAKGS